MTVNKSKLVYTHWGSYKDLYVASADGSNPVAEFNMSSDFQDSAWSPDGNSIAFISNYSGTYDLYVLDCSTGNASSAITGSGIKYRPTWSPDGKKLAFSVLTVANAPGIYGNVYIGGESINSNGTTIASELYTYTLNSDSSGIKQLTNNNYPDASPSWSPDGSEILFSSTRDGNKEIYVMNADGSNVRRLTNNAADDSRPVWSIDGSKIAFVSNRDGSNDLYTMYSDGSYVQRITTIGNVDNPAWLADGMSIGFNTNAGIYTVGTDGVVTHLANTTSADTDPNWSKVTVSIDGTHSDLSFGGTIWGDVVTPLNIDLTALGAVSTVGLAGGKGNDNLLGNALNNRLWGGQSGNDTLNGGQGNDIYYFGYGEGNDIISNNVYNYGDSVFFYNLNQSQLQFTQNNNDLVCSIVGTNDTLTLTGWYDSANASTRIMHATFADGSSI